ncbi:hypothetical protein VNO77_21183 [Canavalia gladiata]|uniref:Homeobox domain-containing protein n=1 Tax=Canavalia gladiata TaxID=3824 RepID=A0AAN9LU40_CANGL
MAEKNDALGLSLSLSLGTMNQSPPLKMNHMQKSHEVPLPINHIRNNSWDDLCQLPDRSSDMVRGIDVNSAPSMVADFDDDNGVSSPNSAVSSISGCKRSERDDDNAAAVTATERTSCLRGSDDDEGGSGDAARKKLRLMKEQSMVLEETFKEHKTLNPKLKQALAEELNLKPRQVEVWFQNRRARTKLKQTEVDCEYLKRCCENLTEENRRLQKEVQELRALKLSPQMYMQMNPPTTLTMCSSCERVISSASSASLRSPQPPPSNRNLLGANIRRPVPVTPGHMKIVFDDDEQIPIIDASLSLCSDPRPKIVAPIVFQFCEFFNLPIIFSAATGATCDLCLQSFSSTVLAQCDKPCTHLVLGNIVIMLEIVTCNNFNSMEACDCNELQFQHEQLTG